VRAGGQGQQHEQRYPHDEGRFQVRSAQRPWRSAVRPGRDGQDRADAQSPTMCRCSEGNVAGLVRLQRRVGQEVAASLLTVRRSEHDLYSTATAASGWSGVAKSPGSMPTPRDLHSGRGGAAPEGPTRRRSLRSGPMPPCLLSRARTLPAVALTIFPRKRARGRAHACLPMETRAVMVIVARVLCAASLPNDTGIQRRTIEGAKRPRCSSAAMPGWAAP
jgi:hypothetical protein